MRDLADFDPDQHATHHHAMAELRSRCAVGRLQSGMVVLGRFDDGRAAPSERTMGNAQAARAPGVRVPPGDRLTFFEYDPHEHTASSVR